MGTIVDIGSRRELFVDRRLVESLESVDFRMHTPQLAPPAVSPVGGQYMTVLLDAGRYRAYYRRYDPAYQGERADGNEGEITCYADELQRVVTWSADAGLSAWAGPPVRLQIAMREADLYSLQFLGAVGGLGP
jgi:hypothetical protein